MVASISSMEVDDISSNQPPRKRLRQDQQSVAPKTSKEPPRLFAPFRALGLITNYVPFVLQTRTHKGATEGPRIHLLTCLGCAWALWEGGKMGLLFVGPDAPEQISSLAMDGDAVWAAAGPHAIKYIRGKEVLRATNPLGTTLSFITIFGSQLLALTEDGSRMLLWNNKEGVLNSTIEFEVGFTAISILHPATYLNKVLVSSSQGVLQLWNIQSQICIHKFPAQRLQSDGSESSSGITSLVQSPAVDVVGIGFTSGEISVYDVRADERLMRMFMEGGGIRALGFRSDGHPILASASSAGHIALWDLNSGGRLLHMIRGAHDGAISAVEWVPGQPILVTSGDDNSVKQWLFDSPTAAPRLLKFRSGHHAPPHLIRYYGTDGKQLLTASRDRSLRCTSVVRDSRSFELSQGSITKKATSLSIPLASLKFPPVTAISYSAARMKDWDDILTAHSEETFARSWTMLNKKLGKYSFGFSDAAKGKAKESAPLGSVKVKISQCILNQAMANWNLLGGVCHRMRKLWPRKLVDGCNPHVEYAVRNSAEVVQCGTLSTRGNAAPVFCVQKEGEMYNRACDGRLKSDGNRQHSRWNHKRKSTIGYQEFLAELAVVCDDMVVRIIDIETQRIVRELGGFRGRILDITFSPDSRWLVATSLDSIIRTFDIPTGRLIDAFRTPSVATSISFSPTNDFLATAHVDSVGVFLWANRAQYTEVSFQSVTDDDLSEIHLPSMQGVAEDEALEALSALTVHESPPDVFSTPPQLDGELITLTLLPRARWQTLLNLEVIHQRNKPKEPPKAPEKAPFFLPTLTGVETRFATAEPKPTQAKQATRRMEKVAGTLESIFYQKLMAAPRDGDYEDFFVFAKSLSPPALDLEIRSLVTLESLGVFANALTRRLLTRRDFEAVQAMQNVFLNIHGDVLIENEELQAILEGLLAVQKKESQRVLDLIASSLGTLGFVRDIIFGFHNASAIDSLLDKEDVSLEAILDEDDLLQECKAQNTRLINYFQRVDVLQRLLGYVTGQIEVDNEKGRLNEIWSIVETCINEQAQLLIPFWETVLDRPPQEMKTQVLMASHFSKISAVFLNKKPVEMFAFIRSQPSIVERLLVHIETPPFVDLISRLIQLDEQPSVPGVLEWLSSEDLMGRLIALLAPTHTSDIHAVVADLIKSIISMATPSPGAGLTEGLQNGPASNRFARELARRENIEKLTSYMLIDFEPPPLNEDGDDSEEEDDPTLQQFPNFHLNTSSVVHSVSMVVELIRKNNSDFFEPYLFHTLRNRLIQVQQQQMQADGRDALERAMKEMVDRMGVVHLGPVLEVMMPKLEALRNYLIHPRSLSGPVDTTVGAILPLTFERYRISELFAELLHCSNMSLLNRAPEANRMYDSEGRLQGGLSALEELAQVITLNSSDSHDTMDEDQDEIAPALELPVSIPHDTISIDSDDDMSDDPGSSDDDAMEEIVMYDEPSPVPTETPLPQPPITVPSSPNTASMPSPSEIATQGAALGRTQNSEPDLMAENSPRSRGPSRKNSRRANTRNSSRVSEKVLPVGERLKQQFLQVGILSTLLDLFFEFPWNNFLHSAVYDVVHQILTGPVEIGSNRELAISLFRDAQLMQRIVDGQKRNDNETAKPKGVRLGYMGHLTLMSEDVIMALERFPPDLRLILIEFAPTPGWDDYVMGRYIETKRKDTRVLGGGKPAVASAATRNATRWKVDEDDSPVVATSAAGTNGTVDTPITSEPRGEFRRAGSMRPVRESSADFGPAAMQDDPEEESSSAPHFARYLAQEMHTSDNTSDDEDEDEEGGWLSQSTFSLAPPPVSARHASSERRPLPLSTPGFDDTFSPSNVAAHAMSEDPFNPNMDDGFGPFSDSTPAPITNGGDLFNFSSSFSDESFDSESFGDFGDFQSASTEGDGELTPTTGSWTFASDSSTDEEMSLEDRSLSLSPAAHEKSGKAP
ncbi:hypothetical protein H0H81_011247 [Sphagnurus paluster]|uniref:Uncharacterized protein n=1 Tax=Sphagnurus paluster TaxID=117069 RepID=A0A9P7FUA0_9AGAR|nr:hypothetical protein H0H81_011247 [Sphagnurus paluster]